LGGDRARVLLHALVVGLLAGSVAILLRYLATVLPALIWTQAADLVTAVSLAPPLVKVAIPTIGALAAGAVLSLGTRWSGASQGWDILEAVWLRDGVLPLRAGLIKSASSLVTQASAGAVGREGPIVLLAATVASKYGQRLKVSTPHLRILAGCGIAAGLACAYNAPLGAALFALEIVFGSLALDVFAPLAVASGTATMLAWGAFGNAPTFELPSLRMTSAWEIVAFALLGVLGAIVAAALLAALRGSAELYRRLKLPRPVAMATAGLVLGAAILGYPELVGNGRSAIMALFERPWGLGHVLALLALRLIVTPLAVGSGTVGGVFTPTLFLGAMLGQAFGGAIRAAMPGAGLDPAAYALVGMSTVLAGTTRAPLTSAVLVFEMTLDYSAIVPLLVGSAIASQVASLLSRDSVYTEALNRKALAARAPAGHVDPLRVGDVMRQDQITVPADLPLQPLLDTFMRARRNHLYLVDAEGRFQGAVNFHEAVGALQSIGGTGSTTAQDLARSGFPVARLEEALADVLDRFDALAAERLPVLEQGESRRLVGTISKRDILAAYSVRMLGAADAIGSSPPAARGKGISPKPTREPTEPQGPADR
jgi:CIC family chloride channel protein